MSEEDEYYYVYVEGGRRLNILTESGANALVGDGTTPFMSINIHQGIVPARQRLEQESRRTEKKCLVDTMVRYYVMFGVLADHVSPQVWLQVPDTEFISLIHHAKEVLVKLTNDRKWTMTGVLQKYDQHLLDCLIPQCQHLRMVMLAMEHGLLKVLAEFCQARCGTQMPCPDVTDTVLCITNNVRITLSAKWSNEKIFKRLESCGLLGQAIRCITQPGPHPACLQVHLPILEVLSKCTVLLNKNFKPGEATGDLLANVVAGKDGYSGKRNDEVMARLRNILQETSYMAAPSAQSNTGIGLRRVCRNCDRMSSVADLLVCSRCKQTYYCSRECQREDWKGHRNTCEPAVKSMERARESLLKTVMAFARDNYYEIMKEVIRVMEEAGVDKSDLLVEADMLMDPNVGSAPALREPPEFKVAPTKGYLEGSRPDEPDWFFKGDDDDTYQGNVQGYLTNVRDHYRRMTSDHLLMLVRYPMGSSGVYRLQIHSEDGSGMSLVSDQALDAFRRALQGDESGLSRVYRPKHASLIQQRINYDRVERLIAQSPDGGESLMRDVARMALRDEFRRMQEEESSDDSEY